MASIDEFIPLFRQVTIEVGELRKEVSQTREIVERLDQKVEQLDQKVERLDQRVERLEETTQEGFIKVNHGLRLLRDEMFDIKVEHRQLEKRIEKLEEKQAA